MSANPGKGPDFTSGVAKNPNVFKTYLKLQRKDHGPDAPTESDERLMSANPDAAADFAAKQRARKNADLLASTEAPSLLQRIRQLLKR